MTDAQLATAINEGHGQVEAGIHTARQHAAAALLGALRTGKCLEEVHRRFGRSGWRAWLGEHCPQLPDSTAYRYLSLARKFPHVRTAEDIPNLRQAYIAAGILPEDKAKAEPKKKPDLYSVPAATGTDLASRVHSAWTFLRTEFERFDLGACAVAERERLQQELAAALGGIQALLDRLQRMAEAAMQPDLYGKVRPAKPWLDYLPRLFFISDMGDALSSEIDFPYLKAEIKVALRGTTLVRPLTAALSSVTGILMGVG